MKLEHSNNIEKELNKSNKESNKTLDDVIGSDKKTSKFVPPKLETFDIKEDLMTPEQQLHNKIGESKVKALTLKNDVATKKAIEEEKKIEEGKPNLVIKLLDDLNKPFNAILGGIEGLFAFDDGNFKGDGIIEKINQGIKAGWNDSEDENGEKIVSGAKLMSAVINGNSDTSKWGTFSKLIIGSIPLIFLGFLDPVNAGFEALAASKYTIKLVSKVSGFFGKVGHNIKFGNSPFEKISSDIVYRDLPLDTAAEIFKKTGSLNENIAKNAINRSIKALSSEEYYFYRKEVKKLKQANKKLAKSWKDRNYQLHGAVVEANAQTATLDKKIRDSIDNHVTNAILEKKPEALREIKSIDDKMKAVLSKEDYENDVVYLHNVSKLWKDKSTKLQLKNSIYKELFAGAHESSNVDALTLIKNLEEVENGKAGTKLFATTPEHLYEKIILAFRSGNFVNLKPLQDIIKKNILDNDLYKSAVKELEKTSKSAIKGVTDGATPEAILKMKYNNLLKKLNSLSETEDTREFRKTYNDVIRHRDLLKDMDIIKGIKWHLNPIPENLPSLALSNDQVELRKAFNTINDYEDMNIRSFQKNVGELESLQEKNSYIRSDIQEIKKELEDIKSRSPEVDNFEKKEITSQIKEINDSLTKIQKLKTNDEQRAGILKELDKVDKLIDKIEVKDYVEPVSLQKMRTKVEKMRIKNKEIGKLNSALNKSKFEVKPDLDVRKSLKKTKNHIDLIIKKMEENGIKPSNQLLKDAKSIRKNLSNISEESIAKFKKSANAPKTAEETMKMFEELAKGNVGDLKKTVRKTNKIKKMVKGDNREIAKELNSIGNSLKGSIGPSIKDANGKLPETENDVIAAFKKLAKFHEDSTKKLEDALEKSSNINSGNIKHKKNMEIKKELEGIKNTIEDEAKAGAERVKKLKEFNKNQKELNEVQKSFKDELIRIADLKLGIKNIKTSSDESIEKLDQRISEMTKRSEDRQAIPAKKLAEYNKEAKRLRGEARALSTKNSKIYSDKSLAKFFKEHVSWNIDDFFVKMDELDRLMDAKGIKKSTEFRKRLKKVRKDSLEMFRQSRLNIPTLGTIDELDSKIGELESQLSESYKKVFAELGGEKDELTIELEGKIDSLRSEFKTARDKMRDFNNNNRNEFISRQADFAELALELKRLDLLQLKIDVPQWNKITKKAESKLGVLENNIRRIQAKQREMLYDFSNLLETQETYKQIAEKFKEGKAAGGGLFYNKQIEYFIEKSLRKHEIDPTEPLTDEVFSHIIKEAKKGFSMGDKPERFNSVLGKFEQEYHNSVKMLNKEIDLAEAEGKSIVHLDELDKIFRPKYGELGAPQRRDILAGTTQRQSVRKVQDDLRQIRGRVKPADSMFFKELGALDLTKPANADSIIADFNEIKRMNKDISEEDLFAWSKASSRTHDERLLDIQRAVLDKFITVKPGKDATRFFTTVEYAKDAKGNLTEAAQELSNVFKNILGTTAKDLIESDSIPVINKEALTGLQELIEVSSGSNKLYSPGLKKIINEIKYFKKMSNNYILDTMINSSFPGGTPELLSHFKAMAKTPEEAQFVGSLTQDTFLKLIQDKLSYNANDVTGELMSKKDTYTPKITNNNYVGKNAPFPILKDAGKKQELDTSNFSKQLSESNFIGNITDINDRFADGIAYTRAERFLKHIIKYEGHDIFSKIKAANGWDSLDDAVKAIVDNKEGLTPIELLRKLESQGGTTFPNITNHYKAVRMTDLITKYLSEYPNHEYEKIMREVFKIPKEVSMTDMKGIKRNILWTLKEKEDSFSTYSKNIMEHFGDIKRIGSKEDQELIKLFKDDFINTNSHDKRIEELFKSANSDYEPEVATDTGISKGRMTNVKRIIGKQFTSGKITEEEFNTIDKRLKDISSKIEAGEDLDLADFKYLNKIDGNKEGLPHLRKKISKSVEEPKQQKKEYDKNDFVIKSGKSVLDDTKKHELKMRNLDGEELDKLKDEKRIEQNKKLNEANDSNKEKTIKRGTELFSDEELKVFSKTLKALEKDREVWDNGMLDAELRHGIEKISRQPLEEVALDPNIDLGEKYSNATWGYGDLFHKDGEFGIQRAKENQEKIAGLVNTITTIIGNGAIKTLEQIHGVDIKQYERISSKKLLGQFKDFLSLSLDGAVGKFNETIGSGARKYTDDEELNQIMKMFEGELQKLTRNSGESIDPGNFYVHKKVSKILESPKDDINDVPLLLKLFDKATSIFKKWTLASPGFLFKNWVGNLTEAYFNTGSIPKALIMKHNGDKLAEVFGKFEHRFKKWSTSYIEKHNGEQLTFDDLLNAFENEIKNNKDKYKDLEVQLSHHNGSRVPKPTNYKLNSKKHYQDAYDTFHLWRQSKIVNVGTRDFLDSNIVNKSVRWAKTAFNDRELMTGKLTYDEIAKKHPEVTKIFTENGLTKENFLTRYTNAIFDKASRSTNASKLGLLYDINVKERELLSKVTGKKLKKGFGEVVDTIKNLTTKDRAKFNRIVDDFRYNEFGTSNITRIVRQSHFDATDLNKFERNVMSRIFPFYNFMKVNFVQNLNRLKKLDFRGLYKYQRLIKSMSINQGIDNKDKSEWAMNNQMVPFLAGKDRALYIKNPVPSMGFAHLLINDKNIINDLFNSSNPLIKYVISSAAGDVNLFFGNTYDNKMQQLIDIFAPRDFTIPFETAKKLNKMYQEPEGGTIPEYMSILFPSIFKLENMEDQRVQKLKAAMYFFESYLDGIATRPEQRLALVKALPMLGYSPKKIDLVD